MPQTGREAWTLATWITPADAQGLAGTVALFCALTSLLPYSTPHSWTRGVGGSWGMQNMSGVVKELLLNEPSSCFFSFLVISSWSSEPLLDFTDALSLLENDFVGSMLPCSPFPWSTHERNLHPRYLFGFSLCGRCCPSLSHSFFFFWSLAAHWPLAHSDAVKCLVSQFFTWLWMSICACVYLHAGGRNGI